MIQLDYQIYRFVSFFPKLDDSSSYIIARATSGQIFTGKADYFHTDAGFEASTETVPFDVVMGFRPSSIAVSPWQTASGKVKLKALEWALAGRRFNPDLCPDSHIAVVELYDAKINQRIWHGQLPLDCSGKTQVPYLIRTC